MVPLELTPIANSSMFTSFGYDPSVGELHLQFKQGGAIHAYPITPEQYKDFKAAPSAGKWFHQHIRGKIEGRKMQVAQAV
jgi:KTSC domain-containing protein